MPRLVRAIVVLASLLVLASSAYAQCRSDEVLVGEDADNYYCNKRNERALGDAQAIRSAMDRGGRPSFQTLWDHYQFNREIARGLAPEQNRCAIVLSMTLGLRPRAGEASLRDLSGGSLLSVLSQIRHKLVIPEVGRADIATRYYIRAEQLASRLRSEWGEPLVMSGPEARRQIEGRRGVILLKDAYRSGNSLGAAHSGDHIDVWNSNRIGSDSSTPFNDAASVWFWEMPK